MRTVLTLCILMLTATTASGAASAGREDDRYWVVGSFKTLTSATSESRRIEYLADQPVRIARFDLPSGTLYRLVVAYSDNPSAQKQALAEIGIEPWTVRVPMYQLEAAVGEPPATETAFNLVVGSFNREAPAEAFAMTLQDRGADTAAVIMAMPNESAVYRVVLGPYQFRDKRIDALARDLGISGAWWTSAEMAHAPEPVGVESMPVSPVEVATPSMPEPAAEPTLPPLRPPEPGESYFDYCVKRATARERAVYCQDSQFAKAAVNEQRVRQGVGGKTYFEFCTTQASKAQREQFCNDATFSNRTAPN